MPSHYIALPLIPPYLIVHAILLLFSTPLNLQAAYPPSPKTVTTTSLSSNATDRLALLSFKSLISDDPLLALASWNKDSPNFCRWRGVTCDNRGAQPRVKALDLDSLSLAGHISPSIANLTFLQRLHLPNNRLYGPIPRELGSLLSLQHLNLSSNLLQGEIPTTLSQCTHLHNFSLTNNKLGGIIPSNLSRCLDLQTVTLENNMLMGEIPTELGSLPRLRKLTLDHNSLTGGIPPSLGNLYALTTLGLSYNQLTGGIPPSIGNSSLAELDLSFNNLSGAIPLPLWNLSSLTNLFMQGNKLSGTIPRDIGHLLPHLQLLHLYENELNGTIPTSLGAIQNLTQLLLSKNQLEARETEDWAFFTALTNCSNLQVLQLSSNKLQGILPSSVGNLSTGIEWLMMSGNQISGSIPTEIGNLVNLKALYASYCLLSGTIPATIGRLQRLNVLSLADNRISGAIPSSLANLSQLTKIYLAGNRIGGNIPTFIGNISNLTVLLLSDNNFEGSIPPSLADLRTLTDLQLLSNRLSGAIPPSIWNLSSLSDLIMGSNSGLTGKLPPDIGQNLPRLRNLYLNDNQLHGTIPDSLSNASALEDIALDNNALQGTIPQSLGALQSLSRLFLSHNQLQAREAADWGFIDALTNCTKLEKLALSGNKLGGVLPNSLANLSTQLYQLAMGKNQISGTIPADIGNLINMTILEMGDNLLTGNIPASIGKLQRLQIMLLDTNKLSGEIPSTMGNLTKLNQLYLYTNELSGSIPTTLANCPLELLNLNNNKLTGKIPREILLVSSLSIYLGLAKNSLTGALPSEVGSLRNLGVIDVSNNRLSGVIPSTLSNCQIMEYLYMGGNHFHGTIPSSLQKLRGLTEFDLSCNNLSGRIPKFLGSFPLLVYLNLSFNNLTGEVPNEGVFTDLIGFSALGNSQLCGGHADLSLPPCSNKTTGRKSLPLILLVVNIVLCFILLCFVFAAWYWSKKGRESEPIACASASAGDQQLESPFAGREFMEVSYDVLHNATDGFSTANLIGAGSFGSVYKGVLDCSDGTKLIAVKVLNLQQRGATKSFVAECEALRNVQHRNLIKVFTSCSGFDSSGNEFKALVFEYMPNGSLDMWLHPEANHQEVQRRLSLIQRLNIAIDVASALDYLHHHGPKSIIHCDLKPANVLLDNDMNARVGDFGLARILTESANNSSSTLGLKGSIGYVAPEYGMANKASTKGDVYSYGILLLEMFTGKRPTDDTFKEGLSLRGYAKSAFTEQVISTADPHLLLQGGYGDAEISRSKSNAEGVQECLASVFRVGISCTKQLPRERMQIADVIKQLVASKIAFLGSRL